MSKSHNVDSLYIKILNDSNRSDSRDAKVKLRNLYTLQNQARDTVLLDDILSDDDMHESLEIRESIEREINAHFFN